MYYPNIIETTVHVLALLFWSIFRCAHKTFHLYLEASVVQTCFILRQGSEGGEELTNMPTPYPHWSMWEPG